MPGAEDEIAQNATQLIFMTVKLPIVMLSSMPEVVKALIEASNAVLFGVRGKDNGGVGGVVGLASSIGGGAIQFGKMAIDKATGQDTEEPIAGIVNVNALDGEQRSLLLSAAAAAKLGVGTKDWIEFGEALEARGVKATLIPNPTGTLSVLCTAKDYELLLDALIGVGIDGNYLNQEEAEALAPEHFDPEHSQEAAEAAKMDAEALEKARVEAATHFVSIDQGKVPDLSSEAVAASREIELHGHTFTLGRDLAASSGKEARTCWTCTVDAEDENGKMVSTTVAVDPQGNWSLSRNGKNLIAADEKRSHPPLCDDGKSI